MLKHVLLSLFILVSSLCFSQNNCAILINDVILLDSISGKYTPVIKEANCEWKKYELSIYNRWGNVMHSSIAINDEWDLSEVNSGTYYYTLKATSMAKEKIEQTGYLTLIK